MKKSFSLFFFLLATAKNHWLIVRINVIRNTVAISTVALAIQAGLKEETKVEGLKYRLTMHRDTEERCRERLGLVEGNTLCNGPTWDARPSASMFKHDRLVSEVYTGPGPMHGGAAWKVAKCWLSSKDHRPVELQHKLHG